MSKARWVAASMLAGLMLASVTWGQTSGEQASQAPLQHRGTGHRRKMGDPYTRLQRMSRALNLTDDQKAKLKPIFTDEWQEMKPIRDDASTSREQKREKMKSIHEKYREQIAGVLTPEQREKWKKMQENHRRRRERMKNQAC